MKEVKLKFPINIPSEIVILKDIFVKEGYKLFLVGGSIRDALIGKQPKDFDLTTNAVPDKVIEILNKAGYKTLETGKAFGVVNVFLPSGEEVEIATFRKESNYSDARRPDSVEFSDIKTDSLRRDLTINSMYYDIDTQEIIDFTGGIEDLKNGVVKTVGNPVDRFNEDRLRKIRAIRFAARMGSELDPATDKALKEDNNMEGISFERIRDEFSKGIKSAKSVVYFLRLLDKYRFFEWVFPNLVIKEKGMQNPDFIEEKDYVILLAYLLQDNDLNLIKKELHRLTYSLDEIKAIAFLIAFLKKYREELINNVFLLKKMQVNSGLSDHQIKRFADLNHLDQHLINSFLKFKLSVSGDEMLQKGLKGAEIGKEIEKSEIENFQKILGESLLRQEIRKILSENFDKSI